MVPNSEETEQNMKIIELPSTSLVVSYFMCRVIHIEYFRIYCVTLVVS